MSASPLTPDQLIFALRTAGGPVVSPDGSRIVYAVTTADRESGRSASQLWMCRIEGGAPHQLTWAGEANGGACWSPDGGRVAFVSDRQGGPGVFVLPADGAGEARRVAASPTPPSELAWSPDGTRIAYTALVDPTAETVAGPVPGGAPGSGGSPTPWAAGGEPARPVRVTRRLDYKQDNRGYLGDARLMIFVTDVAGGGCRQLTRYRFDLGSPQWSPDGRWLAARIALQNGMCSQLAIVSVDTGDVRAVGPEAGVVGCWSWSPDGTRIVFAGDTRSMAQLDFFLVEITTGAIRQLTDDLPMQPDAGFPTIAPPAQPVWLDDRRVLFHALRGGGSRLATIDTVSGTVTVIASFAATHGGLSVDRGRTRAVQSASGFASVGEVAATDLDTGATRLVTTLNDASLRATPPAEWERLIVSRGGLDIEAWLLRPADFDPDRRYPLVLDVHGGPHGYHGYAFNAVQQCLATHGFLVLCVNPRGSATYGRRFAEAVIGDWGGEDAHDLLTVLDAVSARPAVDETRIGIWGYSYGGYMTAWMIGQTDRFRAAVCGAPCFNLVSMYGTSDIGHVFGDIQFGGPPAGDPEWYRQHSPSTFAHRTRTPTLIVHGEADDRCPIGQGEEMFVALAKAGCEVEFVRYPDGSHLFLRVGPPRHRADVVRRILEWFQAHLGGSARVGPSSSSAASRVARTE